MASHQELNPLQQDKPLNSYSWFKNKEDDTLCIRQDEYIKSTTGSDIITSPPSNYNRDDYIKPMKSSLTSITDHEEQMLKRWAATYIPDMSADFDGEITPQETPNSTKIDDKIKSINLQLEKKKITKKKHQQLILKAYMFS